MARRAVVAACAFVAATLCAVPANAQTYATLHVRSFTMSVDRASVALGDPFHLTIEARVDERVAQIDNLTLPDLSGFESLGDERRCVASTAGSDCVEIVTLAATIPGSHTIAGATLDAIDGRNGKPSRFTSDAVSLLVTAPIGGDALGGGMSVLLFGLLRGATIFMLVVVAVFAFLWAFYSRRPKRTDVVAAPAYVPPVPDAHARFRELCDALLREPTRANALRLRAAMRETMNARDDETFGDLETRSAGRPDERDLLRAVERAAFCEEARVADAVREAQPFLIR